MDQRVAKWRRWCEGTIQSNVFTMYLQRDAWQEVSKILSENGQLPESYWWQFMFDTYAHTQAMAVRRQADTHRDAASLGRLIEEVRDDPQKITRDYWLGLDERDSYWMRVAEQRWDEEYGGEVGTHLDPAIPAADFERLRSAARKATDFVNKYVAHADASAVGADITLTLDEIHEAVTVVGDLYVKYDTLLLDSGYSEDHLVPVIQHNWKAVFLEPWMRPGWLRRAGRRCGFTTAATRAPRF